MADLIARRRVLHGDDGVTLIELLISMLIFSAIITVAYVVLGTVQAQTRQNQTTIDNVGQVRLAEQQMDRQIRSGNVLYSPANEVGTISNCYSSTVSPATTPNAGNCMRVYTQTNGVNRCVQWQVTGGLLRVRSWSPTWQTDGSVTGWRIVARNVVNTDNASNPPFVLQGANTPYGQRLVDVVLQVPNGRSTAKPIEVDLSLAGRNTIYGYDPGLCSPVPAAS
jgi:prepilin-type N-terminal cleavage/methylation domain-containing protein